MDPEHQNYDDFRFPRFCDFLVPFSDDVQTMNVCTLNLQNPNVYHLWMVGDRDCDGVLKASLL